jgi:hypothetical protein
MSKRLQVFVEDDMYRELQRSARRSGSTVSQYVRSAIAAILQQEPRYNTRTKLSVVREGAKHTSPAGDVDEMIAEIERGYRHGEE